MEREAVEREGVDLSRTRAVRARKGISSQGIAGSKNTRAPAMPTKAFGSATITSATLASTGEANTAAVGSYGITVGSAVGTGLSNYAITYTGGTLTVTERTAQPDPASEAILRNSNIGPVDNDKFCSLTDNAITCLSIQQGPLGRGFPWVTSQFRFLVAWQ